MNARAQKLGPAHNVATGGLGPFLYQWPSERRLGVLEMGGASAQVAFELEPGGGLDRLLGARLLGQAPPQAWQSFQQSRLVFRRSRGQSYALLASTFLGFGSDAVRALHTDLLVRDALIALGPAAARRLASSSSSDNKENNASSLVLIDACLNRGARQLNVRKPLGMLDLWRRPVRILGHSPGPSEPHTFGLDLLGGGDWRACHRSLGRLVSVARLERATCERGPGHLAPSNCSSTLIGTNFVPWQHLQFVGLGQLFYTRNEMLGSPGAPLDGPQMQQLTARLCALSFEQLNRQFEPKSELESQRNLLACFRASWVLVWLAEVLRAPLAAPAAMRLYDIATLDRLAGESLDWTLGALLAHRTSAAS